MFPFLLQVFIFVLYVFYLHLSFVHCFPLHNHAKLGYRIKPFTEVSKYFITKIEKK